ncbi:FAD-dependent oxidoreductase [Aeromicrobium sp. CFBP 8757]|uniref:NAD(P)/FAD-dependent oxidoreductase n=1 Tax=Aeromicrobium sp. CFBP 8757 TaxID=2775288 RepID=UPI0017866805|nr:NAD(P)/FAD-dependent oxidoreductase [Aeromicrobium sp. CFBP 8757]MBD8605730.1 FAD-dependent oxidoreductase [Aeromicrobium sp. CFBP 8757]
MTDRTDVVVVGAGLAGLACTARLQQLGVDARLLEASYAVGGRVRTDVVDGHLCDVGFQLLNPAYPAVRELVDVDALHLQPFAAGVRVRRGAGAVTLGDPRREPRLLASTLRSGLLRPRELAGLARWAAPILGGERRIMRGDDTTLAGSLDAAGVHGPLREQVLEPFLAGVLADDTGVTSARYARLLIRWFLLGTPALPRDGMRALPAQLATTLTRPAETGTRVVGIDRTSAGVTVRTASGSVDARAVVVATDVDDATGLGVVPAAPTGGLVTWWFSAPAGLPQDRLLVVDGDRGPVVNSAVVSAAAPSYAPPGRDLVQVTTLAGAGLPDAAALAEAARLWRVDVAGWDLLVRHDVVRALPRSTPPLDLRRPSDVGGGVFVCGDHRSTPSIQGALASGQRTARDVATALGAR